VHGGDCSNETPVERVVFVPKLNPDDAVITLNGTYDHGIQFDGTSKPGSKIRHFCLNPDFTIILSVAIQDPVVKIMDTKNNMMGEFTHPEKEIPNCVAFFPEDDKIFLVGYRNGQIACWDRTSGAGLLTQPNEGKSVESIVFFDEEQFAVVTGDGSIRAVTYDIPGGSFTSHYIDSGSFTRYGRPVANLQAVAAPSGWLMYQRSDEGISAVKTWQFPSEGHHESMKSFPGNKTKNSSIVPDVSPDGKYLAVGDGDGGIHVWDWNTCALIKKFDCVHGGDCSNVLWDLDRPGRLFSVGSGGNIRYWQMFPEPKKEDVLN